MQRSAVAAVVVVLLAAGSFAAAQGALDSSTLRTAVCHKTSSKAKPYQRIVVTTRAALKTYIKNAADIIPAPRACPKALLTPTAGGVAMTVKMFGVAEQPDPADPDGSGTATLRVRAGQAQVCYSLAVKDITLPATGAHIHFGKVDASGAVVVPLTAPGASGTSSGCAATTRSVVGALMKNGTAYYVNVHTSDFPSGAIRGQLAAPPGETLLTAAMAGANEKPNPADPNGLGTGFFMFNPDAGKLCYTLAAKNIQLPATASHIHKGDGTIAGPVVIPFSAPNAQGTASGCVTADAALLRDIAANPGGFYANIHSTQYPGGAVRAQLSTVS
jgi:hypothetical protein